MDTCYVLAIVILFVACWVLWSKVREFEAQETIDDILKKYEINREEFDWILQDASNRLKSGELHIVTSEYVRRAVRRILNREGD